MRKPGKALRVFLDANVIFSASYSPEGRSAALFLLARKRLCRLVTSHLALEEAHRNLERQRPDALKIFQKHVPWMTVVPEAGRSRLEKVASIGLDSGDVPILAAAIGHCDLLATGDIKHFGPWMGKIVEGLRVMSLASVIELLTKP
jgi:predicted nucleic acid-binding protein